MAWILIGVGLLLLVVVLLVWLRTPSGTPNLTQEEKAKHYQDQAVPGQGMVEGVASRMQMRSDTKTQATANVAAYVATQGMEEEARALDAKLRKEAIPDAHQREAEKLDADKNTFLALRKAEEKEAGIRSELSGLATEKGLDVNSLIDVNKHFYLTQIDLHKMQGEIQIDLDAADRYDLTATGLIDKLTQRLTELIRERHSIEEGNDPDAVKNAILIRLDKNIRVVEELIDVRQERLLLSEGGETAGRDSEAEADSTADN